MSRETMAKGDPSEGLDSRLLQCVECGDFCAGETANDGELVPVLGTPGGRCPTCDGDEFERVVLTLAD